MPEATRPLAAKLADHAVDLFAAGLAVSAIYVAGFGVPDDSIVSGGTVALGMFVGFLTLTVRNLEETRIIPAIIHTALGLLWLFLAWQWLEVMFEQEIYFIDISLWQNTLAWVAFAVIGYLTYRNFGLSMLIVYALMALYVVAPEWLGGAGEHWLRVAENLWYSTDGIYGRPVEVVGRVVLIFVVFGAVLQTSGAGEILLRMAFAATGRIAGGPAHAAVIGSAAFGTMSGSAIANVVSTGIFTIPIIKKAGFKPKFAGAVEAAASTGGQLMPPVMGVVAFLMADMTGIPYLQVALAATIPALLYYAGLFIVVLLEARRQGIGGIPEEDRVRLTRLDYIRGLAFFVPLTVIVAALVDGRTPQFAGFAALIVATALCLLLFPSFRTPTRIWHALVSAGRTAAVLMIVVAAVGLVVGVINMTGIGLRFAEAILAVSGSSSFFALVLVMFGCLVMGMGVPSGAAYLILALVMGPALERLGLPSVAAHLFIIYFGILSVVTPPVALAAFAAAPIAGSSPMETGFEATRLSIAGFIIPYLFVYNQDILIIEGFDPLVVAWVLTIFLISTWSIASALSGFDKQRLAPWERILRLSFAVLAIFPAPEIAVPAVFGCIVLIALHRRTEAKERTIVKHNTQGGTS